MTRYFPNFNGAARLNPGNRPPLELLPKNIVTLLTEYDEVFTRLAQAREDATAVTGEEHDRAARLADDATAATAARAGKPIPPAANADKLAADRVTTARAVTAYAAAHVDILNDTHNAISDEFWSTQDKAADARTKALVGIDNLIDQLATAVETAVSATAVRAWMGSGGGYYPAARTWLVDAVPDMTRHGLTHLNSTHYPVRDILRGTCHTVLED